VGERSGGLLNFSSGSRRKICVTALEETQQCSSDSQKRDHVELSSEISFDENVANIVKGFNSSLGSSQAV
jgi:hypothetical protein